jgi:hypothetical protein
MKKPKAGRCFRALFCLCLQNAFSCASKEAGTYSASARSYCSPASQLFPQQAGSLLLVPLDEQPSPDRVEDSARQELTWAKENAPLLVAVESVERLDGDAFRQEAEHIRKAIGELLPGVEYSEGGDSFSLLFPSAVKPKKAKQ